MKARLRLISLAVLAMASAASARTAFELSEGQTARSAVAIERGEASLTGLCLMRLDGGEIRGAVVNEFGVKAFDFTFDLRKKKLRIANVAGFLDKWYIRRELRIDLKFLLSAELSADGTATEKNRRLRAADGAVTLENLKRGLTYTFTPLNDPNETTTQDGTEQ